MKIYLIRHGETDWNLEGRFQGREDIPLNDTGIRQAKQCGRALRGENFKAIVTSPLIRARKTAEIIAHCLKLPDPIVEEGITERDFSNVSGMTFKEREAFYASGGKDDKEPLEKLRGRMLGSLREYAAMYYDENIIMISHGAAINCVLAAFSKGNTGTGRLILKNTCINIIHYENDSFRLDDYNLTPEEYLAVKKRNGII